MGCSWGFDPTFSASARAMWSVGFLNPRLEPRICSRLPPMASVRPASARRLPPSHTRPRPTPGRSPHREPTSVSHPRNRSPRGGPYASGRTHSTPTSIPTEPATGQQRPSTDIIELGRRTARGYRNPTNYQLRMLLIAGGLDASTHTQLWRALLALVAF